MSLDLRTVENRCVQFVYDEVEDEKVQTAELFTRLTLDADDSVLVQSPYIVPDKGLFQLMEVQQQQQSVPVTFVTNWVKSTAKVIATAATERYKKRMLDYQGGPTRRPSGTRRKAVEEELDALVAIAVAVNHRPDRPACGRSCLSPGDVFGSHPKASRWPAAT